MRNLIVFLAVLMACPVAYSAELFGTVDAFSGSSYVIDQSGKSTFVSVGLKVFEGQTISSEKDGEVHLVTEDGGIIAVRPNTFFRVDEYKAEGNSTDKIFMSLLKGTVRSITGWVGKYNNSAYRITTPTATIGIRGTDHETTVIDRGDGDEPGTYDNVNEGSTVLKTPHGVAEVTPGKFAFAPKGRAIAPIFLAQQPRFLARRMLKIEARIQQRKEFMHARLEQMREDRIKTPRSIRGNHLDHEQRGNFRGQATGQAIDRRNVLRESRLEHTQQDEQMHRKNMKLNRENIQRKTEAHTERRRAPLKKDSGKDDKKIHAPERRLHPNLKRN